MANNTDYSRLLDGNSLLAIKAWIEAKGYGTVKSIKVGNTSYSPSSGVVSLPAYPTTLPASDVYAWAKAATKPSYSFSEITSRGESWLEWGGRKVALTPIGACLSEEHSANRLAYINGDLITVEYSRDGGTTWTDQGLAASTKSQLCTLNTSITIGNPASGTSCVANQSKTRITITAQDGNNTTGRVYTDPRKMLILMSTARDITLLVEYRTGTNYENDGPWTTFNTYTVSGWSGWNDIPLILGTLGGDKTQKGNIWQLRLTFTVTSVNSSYPTAYQISALRIYGANFWVTPSTLALRGHMYTYDMSKNVTFPAGVSATSFIENGTTLANKYLGKTAKAADSDKLDGQDSTYYLNYNNLTNKPTIPSVSNATITIKQTGISDQTFTLNGLAVTITLADTNTWRPLGTGANDACAGNDFRLSNARPASDVYAWAKASTKPTYTYSEVGAAAASHTHTKSQITDFPTSMPASDVSAWAKASTKPSYNYGEIGAGIVSNALIDVHPESAASTISYYTNDLVNLLARGGTCTATNTTRGTAISTTISNWFDGTPTYGGFSVTAVTDVVEILISLPSGLSYSWGTHYGIGFGNAGWRAKDVKIETGYESGGSTVWKTVYNVTNSGQALHDSGSQGGPGTASGNPWNRIRITLTNFAGTSPRIAQIWTQNYGSKGLAYNFVQTGGSTMYGTLNMQHAYPRTSNTYNLGSSSYQWNNLYSKTIYENGTTLSNKYLGISAKAADSDKLDGQDSAYYLNYNNFTNTPTIPTKSSWNYDDVYIKYSAAQTLTDAQKTQARSNIGAGTSSFTGYTSSNKLSTNYIQNDAGWSSFSGYSSSNKLHTDYINNAAGWTSVTESTVSGWGFTKNSGTVTSVGAGTGLSISGTASVNPTINIASGYKLPTTSEWNLAYSKPIIMLEDNNTTTAGTWLAKTSLISALADGQLFLYKLTKAGASTTTLNVSCNGTASGAKTVYRVDTTKLTTQYGVGAYILLYYNGTYFYCINDYDANSYAYLRQYQSGQNEAGSGTLYPILTRYNLTNKYGSYDTAYARYHTETYIDTSNGYLYAPKVYSGGNEVLTGITSAMVTTALGYTPGTSNFTGYTSSNKLHTDYINNAAGWTSNTGTITGVSINGSSVATSGVANITSIPYSILTNTPTIPATNIIPATTSKHAMLLSTQTSGTAEWSSWSDAGVIASTTSGEVVLLSKGTTNQGKFLGISSNNALGWTSLPEANTTTAGIITIDEQSFAGVKTFRSAPFIGYKKSGSTSGISGAINFVDGTTTYPYRTILRVTEGLTSTSNIVYLPTGTGTLALVGDNNHTHTLSIASGGSSPTALSANATYTLTAGGSTLVFKTPPSGGSAYYANQYNYNYFLDSNSGAYLFSDPIEAQTTVVGLQGGNADIMALGWLGLAAQSSKKSLLFNGNRVDLVLANDYQDYIKGFSIDMYNDDYYTLHIRANEYSDLYGSVSDENGINIHLHAYSFVFEPSYVNSVVTARKYITIGVVMHNITYTHSGSVLLKMNIRGNSAYESAITSYTSLCQLLYNAGHTSANTCLVCSGRYSSYSYVVLGVYATSYNSGLYLVYCTTSNNTVSTLAIANGTLTDTLSFSLVP